jgi:hypothetical protein
LQITVVNVSASNIQIAWGARISTEFKEKVIRICNDLNLSSNFLMAAIAFETGITFSPSIENAAGSGAVGLIQFMPFTATNLGTTSKALKDMTAEQQLDFVGKYFQEFPDLKSLEDIYMAIFMPLAIGKSSEFILIDKEEKPIDYEQNKILDIDNDGKITKGEAATKVTEMLHLGLKQENMG